MEDGKARHVIAHGAEEGYDLAGAGARAFEHVAVAFASGRIIGVTGRDFRAVGLEAVGNFGFHWGYYFGGLAEVESRKLCLSRVGGGVTKSGMAKTYSFSNPLTRREFLE